MTESVSGAGLFPVMAGRSETGSIDDMELRLDGPMRVVPAGPSLSMWHSPAPSAGPALLLGHCTDETRS